VRITVNRKRKGFAPVAMADIAFLLLIFIFITVSVGEAPDVRLPFFKYAQKTGFPKTALVGLELSGRVTIDGSAVNEASLPAVLAGMADPGELVVTLHADASIAYEKVDSLLQTLGAGRFLKVVLITDTQDAPK